MERFEAGDVRLLDIIAWADIGERDVELAEHAAKIREEVEADCVKAMS